MIASQRSPTPNRELRTHVGDACIARAARQTPARAMTLLSSSSRTLNGPDLPTGFDHTPISPLLSLVNMQGNTT